MNNRSFLGIFNKWKITNSQKGNEINKKLDFVISYGKQKMCLINKNKIDKQIQEMKKIFLDNLL